MSLEDWVRKNTTTTITGWATEPRRTQMSFEEWLEQFSDEEREQLCIAEAWNAGAWATFNLLVESGYISRGYDDTALQQLKDFGVISDN